MLCTVYFPACALPCQSHNFLSNSKIAIESSSFGVVALQKPLGLPSLASPLHPNGRERMAMWSSGVALPLLFLVMSLRISGRKKGMEAAMMVQLTSTEFKAQTSPPLKGSFLVVLRVYLPSFSKRRAYVLSTLMIETPPALRKTMGVSMMRTVIRA